MVQLVGSSSLGLGKLIDGKNQFVHIRYSANANGSNMTIEIQADTKYIGIATNSSETAPTSPSDYSWGRFVGTSGTSSYTWIRYSSNEDGSNMTTTTNEETKYIGVAITSENSAPTDHTKYSWALFKGEDGRGVKKTEVSYQKSTSGTVIPTGSWLTSIPSLNDGEYLWTRTLFTYTDDTTTSTYNVSRNGTSGLGIARADVHYQKSTSGTTAPIGTWTVTIPAVGANEYLWTRTTITYTDYSTSVSYSVGKMGADGKDAQLLYLTASSQIQAFDKDDRPKTTQPITISVKLQNASGTATFTAIPYIGITPQNPITLGGTGNDRTLLPSQWVNPDWTTIAITATLGSLTDTVSIIRIKDGDAGNDGIPGRDGVGLKTTDITYGVSNSEITQPTSWNSQVPTLVKGKYLWTKTVWTYTDNSTETGYQKTYIARDGNNGQDGLPGKDGVGIASTTITYAASTSGTTHPTSGWSSQVPSVPGGQYLWTKTTWTYTDGTSETGYSVAKMGERGPQGLQGIQGPKGDQGIAGPTGADGRTSYTHIAYANSADGNLNFSVSDSNRKYIGMYVDFNQTDSTNPSSYQWSLIKGADGQDGADGLPGKPGADGRTPYFHTAWADSSDGRVGFSTTVSLGKKYLGTYTDFTSADSTDPTKYNWTETSNAIEQNLAWSWSPDGKDRFTREKPNENLLKKNNFRLSNIDGSNGQFLNNYSNNSYVWFCTNDFISVNTGEKLITTAYETTIFEKYVFYKDGVFVRTTGNNIIVTNDVNQVRVCLKKPIELFKDKPLSEFLKSPLKLEKSDTATIYTTNPQDDYDNSTPRYIGRSLKDSTNPADFTWEPNPERKPWTAYAQGLNGEGFSLVPYGENKLLDSSIEVDKLVIWKVNSATIAYDTARKTSGNRSVKVVTSPPISDSGLAISYSGLVVGATYTVSADIYTENASTIKLRAAKQDYLGDETIIALVKGVWQRIDWTFTAPAESGMFLLMQFNVTFWVDCFKLELANTMGIPTPWTPAPSEDPLGAIPKYVGTAALPYTDYTKYAWTLNPAWLQQRSEETESTANEALEKAKKGAISGYLTNESILLDANASGTVTDFSQATGSFVVYDGQDKVTSGVAYSLVSQTGVTVSIANSGTYNVTAISSKVGTAILQAVYKGVTLQKILTVAKAQTGATGSTGPTGPKGDPTGIVISATAPSNPYVNMLWKHTGSVSGLIKDATYRWNGSKWELYIFTAANITAENLSAITANLGTVTAGTITGSEFTNDFNRSYTNTLNRTGTTKLSGGKLRIDYKDVNKSTGAVSANGSYMEYNESGIDFAENDGTASGKRLELNSNRIALGSSNGTFYADPTKMQLSGDGYFQIQSKYFLGSPGNTNYQKLSWTNDGFELRPVDVNGNPRSWSTGIEIAGNNSYVDFKVPYNSNVDYDTRIILNQDKSFLIENAASGKPITLKTYDNLRVFTDNALIVRNRADSSWKPVYASGFSQQSDEKWKYNIKDMPSRLEQFKNLDFKAYRLWAENGKYQEGVIANDNIVLPFISKGYDGYTVDSYTYITFIGKATQEYIVQTDNTINELKNENAELKNKVTNLESELSNLTTELETIKQQLSILLNK